MSELMRAAFITETGPADNLQVSELPVPVPGEMQVRIRVMSAAVNPIDTYIRSGMVAMDLPKPYIVGCDLAGVVDEVGSAVEGIAVGDRVWCSNQGLLGRQGTFAEYAVVDQCWVNTIPDEISFETAAACALVGITAHLGLFRYGALRAGETVFVVGGSGGVGAMVLQMAKAVGAHVVTTAGGEAKAARCMQLGADEVIDYQRESISEGLKRIAPEGVNLFWETRRAPDFDQAVEALAHRGRMILMAGRDARPSFPVGPFYVKECSLHGFVMFKATPEEQRPSVEAINTWLAAGVLQAQIGVRYPLERAADAHRAQEAATIEHTSEISGKIIVNVSTTAS